MTGVLSRNKVVYITYSILDESGRVFEQQYSPIGYVHGVNSPLLARPCSMWSMLSQCVTLLLRRSPAVCPMMQSVCYYTD